MSSAFSIRCSALRPMLAALALTLGAGLGHAAGPAPASTAHCDGVQQDRAACLREAGAARHEAQRGGLSTPPAGAADANALARCQAQPAAERSACEARVRGSAADTSTSTSTSGSVMGGGVIRETTTTTVTPAQPAPAPAPAR